MEKPEAKEGTLSPFRALDLTDEQGFLCGKILGDLGADVIKVERPGGDPSRRIGPFYKDIPDPEKSLHWFAYNNNKRGITLNIETATGQEIFRRLVKKADFVMESFPPGHMDRLGLGYSHLSEVDPRIIVTSITPFGQTGPYSQYNASDLEIMALGGIMSLAGEPGRPPLRVSFPQSYQWAGMNAALGTLMAHHYREASGEGQYVDVSMQASILMALAHAPTFWDMNRVNAQREGALMTGRSITGAKMNCIFPCKDGYLNFIIYGGPAGIHTNRELTAWMDSVGMATDWLKQKDWNSFDIATVTQEEIDEIERPAAAFFKTLTKKEFFEEVVKRGMLGYPVNTAEEITNDPQLESRCFWVELEHPELRATIAYPGAFTQFSETSCGPRRRAPLIGEHNEEVYIDELGFSRAELVMLKQANII